MTRIREEEEAMPCLCVVTYGT